MRFAEEDDDILPLNRCIYGLVHPTRQYHEKAVEFPRKFGFNGGEVDPCLFWKQYKKCVVFVPRYVDDNLIVGHPEAIEDIIEQLRKNGLKDYLSCEP